VGNIEGLAMLTRSGRLGGFDLAIVALYLVGITLFGLRFRKRETGKPVDRSLKSYFLADNTIPWWAIALSIVSAETSTLTIISIPGVAFSGNFGFLQVALGYMVGRVVVALLFLPKYFAGEMLTAYQLIDRRFGAVLHKVTAGLFLITRAAAEGVRVFAVSIVVGIAIGTRDVLSIAIISALTLLYTFEGGMAAVIWTDVVQMAIYVGGTVVALVTLGSHVTGGWAQIHHVGVIAGKFHWLDFTMNLTQTYTFWAGVLGGTFLTMASHGTDQLMVQRLLAARSLRQSQAALLSSGIVIFAQFAMFLLIGTGLFVFYGQHPEANPVTISPDRLFPNFVVHEMPVGIAGLLVAAILAAAMSNLSAALNSLSSTTVVDFYVRLRPRSSDARRTLVAKSSTVMWALVLFVIAMVSVRMGGKGHVVEIGLSIASVAYGCLLGVFLLGTLTKFASELGASVGMIVGFAVNVWLWQGTFPVRVGGVTIPHIAWTWYVLIGAAVTFAVGAGMSLLNKRANHAAAIAVLAMLVLPCCGRAQGTTAAPDFSRVSDAMNDALRAHKLPGAVVLIGHGGKIVFERAYGLRKLAGEPGLNGLPSPAEAMTEDTIFDMASLTKCLATATAILQFHEQGKVEFDAPVQTYLPEFNPGGADPVRAKVTLRMLLTHTSGEPADISLKDPWGLTAPDKAEGFHRAVTQVLQSAQGAEFRYSDVNFILLGMIVEKISGEPEDVYAQEHIFTPLGMQDTRYLPSFKACGARKTRGAAIAWAPAPAGRVLLSCTAGTWSTSLLARIAPTAHDDEGKAHPDTNPDFDYLLRGVVHDPTTRRMGGVAGHAGVFSTALDVSLFAQALLDRQAGRPSSFPLTRESVQLMARAEQPSGVAADTILTRDPTKSIPTLMTTKGTPVRGFGWDINSAFSRPRGAVFPTVAPSEPASTMPSFGHTGFTGTSLWMDPGSDTYVIVLANAVHPRGNPPISGLRGDIATAVGEALGLATPQPAANTPAAVPAKVRTGIDVLENDHFSDLAPLVAKHDGRLQIGLLTNQTGLDGEGRRTVDVLANDLPKAVAGAKLVRLFSPEHGLFGRQDTTAMASEADAASGWPVTGLYGAHASDRRPSHEQLKDLDAVAIDIQDAGVRFYTYETVLGYFLEAAAAETRVYGHALDVIVLDRPVPIDGVSVQGPVSDPEVQTYTNYLPLPVRHGLTLGELARYDDATKGLGAAITVVAMQGWTRAEYFDETGLAWVNPSPNLRSVTEATLYPGVAFLEGTNVSVGRGTATPFEVFGAGVPAKDSRTGVQAPAWFHAAEVAAVLNQRGIAGVRFEATSVPVAEDANHYPFHGQTIEAVRIVVTNRNALDSPELGAELLSALHHLYPTQFLMERAAGLVANKSTMEALARGDDPRAIGKMWQPALVDFLAARKQSLLY
jgi:SSS family transporter